MKKILSLLFILSSLSVFSQNDDIIIEKIIDSNALQINTFNRIKSDSSIIANLNTSITNSKNLVLYEKAINKVDNRKKFALFINSIFMGSNSDIYGINPEQIDSIHIERDTIVKNNIIYYGSMHIFYKSFPNLISLDQVKEKYGINSNIKSICAIDGEFLQGDLSIFKIDPDCIWKVYYLESDVFDAFKDKKSTKFTIINIITKTEENMKEKILIR